MSSTRKTAIRSERLVARIAPPDKVLVERAAALEGASVANFVVAHLRHAAEAVIERHEAVRLNAEESHRFVTALLSPVPKPPKSFKKALTAHRATVTGH